MKRILISDTKNQIGNKVYINGWINSIRSHGKIAFLDIRDRSGIIQCYLGKGAGDLSSEDVIGIEGLVKKRPEKMINPKQALGMLEIETDKIHLLNKSQPLPFPINTDGLDLNEEIRLKYRYLDLRRKRLQSNLKLRSKLTQLAREFLFNNDFTEIETPLLTKSTPEGSRDFLVPSRMQPGYFYALPQSPQQYKQLLMVAGFERYFQIARCLRDEDLRADRGFEHTQIDIEISFADREEVMSILEDLMIYIFENLNKKILKKPFPIFTYNQAIEKFGADKFDLRNEKEKKEGQLAFAWVVDFPFFERDQEKKWTFTHNPFSNPKDEYITDLLDKKNIGKILTSQYDLVCNGFEVGGGSIRSNKAEVLERVFEIMGYKKTEIRNKFGHMLEAFSYGAPPHGGCAFGIDRLAMILTNEKYLREVVAFPMTSGGRTSIMDAPSLVTDEQLEELSLKILKKNKIK